MKKLMIAAAIVCAAAFAQAANVTWGSGLMYAPSSNTTGGWDWNKSVQSAGIVYTETVFLLASEKEFNTIKDYSQADLYAYYQENYAETTPTAKASNKNAQDTILNLTNPAITGEASKWYYSLVIAETTVKDASTGKEVDMYMAAAVSGQASGTGLKNFSNIFGGTTAAHGVANWQVAPEPTSGLLLLLGVAGLALRRRRA